MMIVAMVKLSDIADFFPYHATPALVWISESAGLTCGQILNKRQKLPGYL